jgi:hypothetical protein
VNVDKPFKDILPDEIENPVVDSVIVWRAGLRRARTKIHNGALLVPPEELLFGDGMYQILLPFVGKRQLVVPRCRSYRIVGQNQRPVASRLVAKRMPEDGAVAGI